MSLSKTLKLRGWATGFKRGLCESRDEVRVLTALLRSTRQKLLQADSILSIPVSRARLCLGCEVFFMDAPLCPRCGRDCWVPFGRFAEIDRSDAKDSTDSTETEKAGG